MSSHSADLYKILQVDPQADPEVVEAAFRRLAHKYHPDKNGAPDATTKFQEILGAYEVLRDPVTRKQYDFTRFAGSSEYRKRQEEARRKAEAEEAERRERQAQEERRRAERVRRQRREEEAARRREEAEAAYRKAETEAARQRAEAIAEAARRKARAESPGEGTSAVEPPLGGSARETGSSPDLTGLGQTLGVMAIALSLLAIWQAFKGNAGLLVAILPFGFGFLIYWLDSLDKDQQSRDVSEEIKAAGRSSWRCRFCGTVNRVSPEGPNRCSHCDTPMGQER